MLWDLERNQFLSSPPNQHSDSGSKQEPQGTPFLPCLWAPQIAPNSCQAPSPPAPGHPTGRTHRGQHTLPTRPEINISRETELVLSVFTAKGQARGGGGASQRNLVLDPKHPAQHCLRLAVCL